jgi:hypothetical protein
MAADGKGKPQRNRTEANEDNEVYLAEGELILCYLC